MRSCVPSPPPASATRTACCARSAERERLRLDEFVTEFTIEELFPPGLENALGRTRQFVSFARAAGLLNEDRGTVELTDMGKRYVRASDASKPFDVAPAQAEWLRRLLRERHMTDSIFHGTAVGLSLYASNPADFRASMLDFGRALNYLGRAGWDNDNTFESQGERYTDFLADLELIDGERRLTAIGQQTRDELTLPIHMSLKDIAGQLNPGGLEAAVREGEAEWSAAAAPPPAPVAETPAPVAGAPAAEPAPAVVDEDEYEDVGPGAGPSPRRRAGTGRGAARARGAAEAAGRRLGGGDAERPHAGLPGRRRRAAGGRDARAGRCGAGRADRGRARRARAASPPPAGDAATPAERRPIGRRRRRARAAGRARAAARRPRRARLPRARSSPPPRSAPRPRRPGCGCPRASTRRSPRRSRAGTSCSSGRPAAARRRWRSRSPRPPRSPASRPGRRS